MNGPVVSAVIPVKDDARRLRLCLEALGRQTMPPGSFEAVVADNGSVDDPASVVADFPFARLEIEPKAGPAAARNRGFKAARGETIAFTDADCLPHPDWLENGLRRLKALPGGGLLAGRVSVVPGNPLCPTALELYDMVFAFDQKTFVEKWHFGATANVFVTRAAAESAGGFDESVSYYGEDVDFGRRIWRAGRPVVYAEDAVVSHPARADWASFRTRQALTVRAAATGDRTLRRLALDLWYDYPTWGAILRAAPSAGGPMRALKLAAAAAAARLLRARFRLSLFWEQKCGAAGGAQ